jgi:uncharacterized tellurite resistance protein B-like protein
MSILSWLGLAPKPDLPRSDVATVHKIGEALERLPPEHAKFVGTFALLLARVAHADLHISDDEIRHMEQAVEEHAALSAAEAALAVEIARMQQRLFGVTEGYLASREFKASSNRDDRLRLLDALFAVAAADGNVAVAEEEVIRQIASELGLDHSDYVQARGKVRGQREVLKGG